ISPHGILELTAVFLAAGAGLKLGWAWIDPGPLPRTQSLANAGRVAVIVAVRLVGGVAGSGLLGAFGAPSFLAAPAGIGMGVAAEAAFLTYVTVLGRRAVRAGVTGDVERDLAGDTLPVA